MAAEQEQSGRDGGDGLVTIRRRRRRRDVKVEAFFRLAASRLATYTSARLVL